MQYQPGRGQEQGYAYGVVGYNQNAAYSGTANGLAGAGGFGQLYSPNGPGGTPTSNGGSGGRLPNRTAATGGQEGAMSQKDLLHTLPAQQEVLVPNTAMRILYDYVASERGVLSLRAGDVATLVEVKDAGWCILKTTAGQQGYFPQSYIDPAAATCGKTQFLQLLEVKQTANVATSGAEKADNKVNRKVVEALLKENPQKADKDGRLALHDICMREDANVEVVEALLKAFPQAAEKTDENGRLPLHCACESGCNIEVVEAVLKAFPQAAHSSTNEGLSPGCTFITNGELPLHLAFRSGGNIEVVEALLKVFPQAAEKADSEDKLPLHDACRYGCNIEVVEAVLKAFPQAAEKADSEDKLPLHLACKHNSKKEVVEALLKAFPRAAEKADNRGSLPLQIAIRFNAKVVEALLKVFPQAAEKASDGSTLPLHDACRYGCNIEVVEAVLKAFPQAAEKADSEDKLPLHLACKHNSKKEVVEALLKAFPRAAEKADNRGSLPLQIAIRFNANKEVLQALLLPSPALECFDFLKDEFLKKILEPDLNEKVLHSAQPLRVALSLSSGLFRLSRQYRSTDTRVSSKADERATEILQLACAVARSLCPFYHSEDGRYVKQFFERNLDPKFDVRKDLDACLKLMVAHRLKVILSEPDFVKIVGTLWFGNGWQEFMRRGTKLGTRIFYVLADCLSNCFSADWEVELESRKPCVWFVPLFLPFLSPFLVLTIVWPPVWRFWLDRLAYLAFCIIAYLLPRQIVAGADITSPGLEVAAAVLLFSFLWQEAAQFTRILRKSVRRWDITHAELLVKIKDAGVKVDKALERHKKPVDGSELGAAPDSIILPQAKPELEEDSELGTAINELKKILRQLDIQNSGRVLTPKDAAKITAAGHGLSYMIDIEVCHATNNELQECTPELFADISSLMEELEKFKKSNSLLQWSVDLFHLVNDALSRYTDDIWNILDVIISLSALAAAVARGCLFARVGNITPTAAEDLYMIALWLVWFRLVAVLHNFSSVGPLLRIFEVMILQDVGIFVILVFFVALPFVTTLSHRFGGSEDGVGNLDDYQTFGASLWTFMKMFVGNGPDLDNSDEKSEKYHLTGETYYLGYPASGIVYIGYFVLVIAMANLLIAMFAKTFDIVYENATQEYLFKFAERTIEWRNAPNLPPPLNVVVDLLRTVQWLLSKLGCPFVNQTVQPEQTDSNPFDLNSFLDNLEVKLTREEWITQVLDDFEENSDFGSDSQMEKFKSTMLKRSKKLESVLEQQVKLESLAVTQGKTLESQAKKLSEMT